MDNIIHFSRISSTNTYIADVVRTQNHAKRKIANEYTGVYADFQTQGRGRKGNTWLSEKGKNLLFSILLYPDLQAEKQFIITEWIALAVSDFLGQNVGLSNVRIKWPNDIYINNKKIGGLLIEHNLSGNKVIYSIIGMGLNVNQEKFPKELPNPTSIFLESGKVFSIEKCLNEIVENLKRRRKHSPESLHEDYLEKLYLMNEECCFLNTKNNSLFSAQIVNVTQKGLVQLKTGSEILNFEFNEIKYRIKL